MCGGTPTRSRLPNQQQNLFLSCFFSLSLSRLLIPHNNTNCHTLSPPFCLSVRGPTHRVAGERKEEKKMGKRETDQMSAEPFPCYCGCGGHHTHTAAAALSLSISSFFLFSLPCDLMITIFSPIPLQPLNLIIKERNKTKRTQNKKKK